MAWPADYNAQFLANPGQNNAEAYGITVNLANAQPGMQYWHIIGIAHLTGAQNGGNHHVYLDVLDELGQRINGAIVAFTNNNLSGSVKIDKPADEAGANIPMLFGDTLNVWASDILASDEAKGFHTRHENEEAGNTRGHHSFYVVFQRTTAGQDPQPIPGLPGWQDKLTSWEQGYIRRNQRLPYSLDAQIIIKLVKILDGEL